MEENRIKLNNVEVRGNTIQYQYTVIGKWKKYFSEEPFYVEYEEDISDVPESIQIIPFLSNFLPMVWIWDATMEINEIDKTFLESISEIKKGYETIYPMMEWKGNIKIKKVVENKNENKSSAMLFSGGMDSFSTLLSHLEEKPKLFCLWGSDVDVKDISGWDNVKKVVDEDAKMYRLEAYYVKTTFRKVILEGVLSEYTMPKCNDGWWHGFQHGIAIIGQIAPLAYKKGIYTLYRASSYNKSHTTCASCPEIDNAVKFGNCQVIYDQDNWTRSDKASNIVERTKNNPIKPKLHVCWISKGGENCCDCEKCYRSIFNIQLAGGNPKEYGFMKYNDIAEIGKKFRKNIVQLTPGDLEKWYEVKEAYEANPENMKDKNLQWIATYDFEKLTKQPYIFIKKVRRKLREILKLK